MRFGLRLCRSNPTVPGYSTPKKKAEAAVTLRKNKKIAILAQAPQP